MRKSSLTLLAAVIGLAASQAVAADLPRKAPPPAAPPPPPPVLTWTGCYIGANIGGVDRRLEANFDFGSIDKRGDWGFTGGGQIGCDYQFAGAWVLGFRNMFNGTTGDKDITINRFGDPIFDGATVNLKNQWFDALTARLGYAWSPAWLMYFQGGAVWSEVKAEITSLGGVGGFSICNQGNVTCDFGSASKTRTGWTVGGGVEWRFAPQWSAFLEGNYYDFGDRDRTLFTHNFGLNGCDFGCSFNTKVTAATVLIGVNYRWGWGGKAPYATY
jgi:outer membrane immunogenic protein